MVTTPTPHPGGSNREFKSEEGAMNDRPTSYRSGLLFRTCLYGSGSDGSNSTPPSSFNIVVIVMNDDAERAGAKREK